MKKLAVFLSIVCSLLIVSLTLFSKTVQAETSKKVDVITEIKIQNSKGEELATGLGRYDTFRLNAKFALEGKDVKAGDTTEVVIASPIDIKSQDFEINDSITGKKIADAKVDAKTGKIVLTFTEFVQKKNDVSGSFFFYAGVNKDKFPNDGEAPVKVSVNDKVKFTGKVTSKVGDVGNSFPIFKSGWTVNNNKELGYRININRTNQVINNAVVSDTLQSKGVTYRKGSFKILKGTWEYAGGKWTLKNPQDVTADYTVNATDTSFSINFGNLGKDDHFVVEYQADINYTAVDGERIKNLATIRGDGLNPEDKRNNAENGVNIQIAGGTGIGYEFSIKVTKVDEKNGPLKGAKFQVIRATNQDIIGEFDTDANGEFTVKNILRDKYIIKEVKAPEGYELAADTVVEAGEFKTPKAPVAKNIVDQKTTTTTTTTTTTEEPTTTTTTTPEPTTTTTTTAEPTTTTTTTAEPTTTTTTTAEPTTTTTTTAEPTTTTTTTAEPTTTTTTTAEPTTTTTTTTAEPTTTTTTTAEPTTTTTTTVESTTTTTTTAEPTTTTTTTSTTTTEESTTTSTTTTEEPTTTSTTTAEPTTTTTTTEEPKTTSTTTAEPTTTTTTTAEPTTTTTTPEKPVTPGSEGSTTTTTTGKPGPKGGNNGGGRKALLPNTGEVAATGFVFSGAFVLAGAVVLKRKLSIK